MATNIAIDPRHAALAQLVGPQDGVFHLRQAEACGFAPGTIRSNASSGRWQRLHDRVYAYAGLELTWRRRLIAALLAIDGDALAGATREAALYLHGFARLVPQERPAIVVDYAADLDLADLDVRVHRSHTLTGNDLTEVDGIAVTTVARTLLDLCPRTGYRLLREHVADALRRHVTTREELRAQADRAGRLKGKRVLLGILDELDPQTERTRSGGESEMLTLFVRGRLPRPVVNYPIYDEAGRLLHEIDFAYPPIEFGIELHSEAWHTSPGQLDRDARRQNLIQVRAGWKLVVFTYAMVRDQPWEVIRTIREALEQHTGRPIGALRDDPRFVV